jgi:hypothetical protein
MPSSGGCWWPVAFINHTDPGGKMLKKAVLKKWSTRIAVAAVAGGMLLGTSLATSASAGVCTTRGCGGVITNDSSRGIFVSNNWCWNSQSAYYGNTLPCATTWNDSAYRSYFYLLGGDSTADFYYFYDTDAYRIDPHCTVTFAAGAGFTSMSNSSSTPLWRKITNIANMRVVKYTC